jgi:hypothetical protein
MIAVENNGQKQANLMQEFDIEKEQLIDAKPDRSLRKSCFPSFMSMRAKIKIKT